MQTKWFDPENPQPRVFLNVVDSTSVDTLYVQHSSGLNYVGIRFKSNPEVAYMYHFADMAQLWFTLLTQDSAGKAAHWIKSNADYTSKIDADGVLTYI